MLRFEGFTFRLSAALGVLTPAAANVNLSGDTFAVVAVVLAARNAALDAVDSFFFHSDLHLCIKSAIACRNSIYFCGSIIRR